MDLQLKNKIALVTGSTAGIGESIAKTLAQEGARVVIHGRKADAAKRVTAEILETGGQATSVLGDLADDKQAAQVATAAKDAFGQIDILINNAGVFPQRGWWDSTPTQWVELYNQNVASMVRMIQAFVPDEEEWLGQSDQYFQWCRFSTIGRNAGLCCYQVRQYSDHGQSG